MIDVVLFGGTGRTGSAIAAAIDREADLRLLAHADLRRAEPPKADVFIDFTSPEATEAVAGVAARSAGGLVVGTTGIDAAGEAALDEAAAKIPVVVAPNMSVGVNLLYELTRRVAEALPESDVEIVEWHHRHKVDAPSGTAVHLTKVLRDVRGGESVAGRSGAAGPRGREEIGVHALRGGDVVGEHTVLFAVDGERIELTHRASSRLAFAGGALRAARFVVGRAPGRYSMGDVLK